MFSAGTSVCVGPSASCSLIAADTNLPCLSYSRCSSVIVSFLRLSLCFPLMLPPVTADGRPNRIGFCWR